MKKVTISRSKWVRQYNAELFKPYLELEFVGRTPRLPKKNQACLD